MTPPSPSLLPYGPANPWNIPFKKDDVTVILLLGVSFMPEAQRRQAQRRKGDRERKKNRKM
jgi:hypothetical protein